MAHEAAGFVEIGSVCERMCLTPSVDPRCPALQAYETNLMYTYALNVGNFQYLIQVGRWWALRRWCPVSSRPAHTLHFLPHMLRRALPLPSSALLTSTPRSPLSPQDLAFTTVLAALMGYTRPR